MWHWCFVSSRGAHLPSVHMQPSFEWLWNGNRHTAIKKHCLMIFFHSAMFAICSSDDKTTECPVYWSSMSEGDLMAMWWCNLELDWLPKSSSVTSLHIARFGCKSMLIYDVVAAMKTVTYVSSSFCYGQRRTPAHFAGWIDDFVMSTVSVK